jgi:DNA-binding NarL/FixJ family response regulator
MLFRGAAGRGETGVVTTRLETTVRVLILDDHALFRESLARLLDAEPDMEMVGHCASVDDALRIVESRPVDLVLLDVDLGTGRGADFLARARAVQFGGRVLIVTAGLSGAEAAQLLAQGAAGIFFKEDSAALLTKGIRTVMEGGAWIDQRHLASILAAGAALSVSRRTTFTAREQNVLRGVFEGLANKEIAAGLGISESGVKATLQQLFDKTGVRTRSQLVRVALERHRDEL